MTQAPLGFSVYLGLFASLMLALACNAFLDIQYGSFSREMIFWTVIIGWTMLIGWRQNRKPTASGKAWQKGVLFFGLFLFFFVFLRIWDMPRAGLYLLVMLQASYNCITTGRRELNLGLLVSLALVLFATSHYRADWTMLFYLAPYVAALVFTLVAEQIQRRGDDLRRQSLGRSSSQGQGVAILAATIAILLVGGGLYKLTPQVSWPYLEWQYGQISPRNPGGELEQQGSSGQNGSGKPADGGGQNQAPGSGDNGPGLSAGSRWPTPAEMRAAAKRPNMPGWQAKAIEQLADVSESVQQILQPVVMAVIDLWEALKQWLKQHWLAALLGLLALLLLIILIAFGALLREVPWVAWLLTQWDYLRLGVLARHADGERGAIQYYRAMARLFALQDEPRPEVANTREYLAQIGRRHRDLHKGAAEMTWLFEQARYGAKPLGKEKVERMRALYRELYWHL
jgi:hypothetical protein